MTYSSGPINPNPNNGRGIVIGLASLAGALLVVAAVVIAIVISTSGSSSEKPVVTGVFAANESTTTEPAESEPTESQPTDGTSERPTTTIPPQVTPVTTSPVTTPATTPGTTTAVPVSTPTLTTPTVLGTDWQGFIGVPDARCNASDAAVAVLRTAQSKISICFFAGNGRYYYRGWSSPGGLELDDPVNVGGAWTVSNNGTTYRVSAAGLQVSGYTNQTQPAIEYWSR